MALSMRFSYEVCNFSTTYGTKQNCKKIVFQDIPFLFHCSDKSNDLKASQIHSVYTFWELNHIPSAHYLDSSLGHVLSLQQV